MKHPIYAVFVVLGLIGLCSQATYAEGDDSGHTPTKRVDVKTRLMKASLTRSTYGIEGKDWNVAQTTEIRTKKFHAPTPRFHPLAATISTKELHEQIIGPEPPLLIDVLEGKNHRSVPGTLWLKGAGLGDDREENVDARLGAKLEEITDGDRMRSIVFFCLSAECWLSYNAALRDSPTRLRERPLVPRRRQRLEEGEAADGEGQENPMVAGDSEPTRRIDWW